MGTGKAKKRSSSPRCRCKRDEDGKCRKCLSMISLVVDEEIKAIRDLEIIGRQVGVLQRKAAEINARVAGLRKGRKRCRRCDEEYLDLVISRFIRELVPGLDRKNRLVLMSHYVTVAKNSGVDALPLSRKAWEEVGGEKWPTGSFAKN